MNRTVGLTWRERLNFGAGSVASNLSWNMVAGFLILYYTDVALLPVAAVGTLVLVTRVIDAMFDPVVGLLVDRTRSRFGKARPYLLFAPIPFAALCVLTFMVPDIGPTTKLAYACVTFGLLGLSYSLLYVPYGALQPLLSADSNEQLKLSGIRAMGTSVASIIVYALVMPAVTFFAARTGGSGYAAAAAAFALATTLLYWMVFLNCRERQTGVPANAHGSVWKSLRELVRNRIWIIAMLFEVLVFIRLGMLVPAMPYYSKEVLHRPAIMSVLLPLMSIAILTGGMLGPWYLAKLHKRRGMLLALGFTSACFLVMPFCLDTLWLLLTLFFLAMMSNGVQATMVFTMITESVEFQERKFGTRSEGLVSSSTGFSQKVGFAVGSSLVAYALAFAGYDPKVPQPAVSTTLIWLVSAGPILIAILQAICIAFYDVDEGATHAVSSKTPAVLGDPQEFRA